MGNVCQFCLFLAGFPVAFSLTELSCKNENGDPVDWFLIYKLPDINKHPSRLVQEGLGFLYMDQFTDGWVLSDQPINATKHALGYTLKQIYLKKNNNAYKLLYNDQPPGIKSNSYRGHTKGVQLFNPETGFWLIHSVPQFPKKDEYEYPETGLKNGQSMLCVSFETAKEMEDAEPVLETIGKQMFLKQPTVYDSNLPARMGQRYPTLARVIGGKSTTKAPFYSRESLTSKGGRVFASFAKHRKWGKDIYSDLVAPSLQESIYVQTWLNGPGDLDSSCDQEFTVHNLRAVDPDSIHFTSSKDHSKWAVSLSIRDPWVCVGDVNRQKSQVTRGGGTMCFKDAKVWQLYRDAAKTVEECPPFFTSGSDGQVSRALWSFGDSSSFKEKCCSAIINFMTKPIVPTVAEPFCWLVDRYFSLIEKLGIYF